MGISIATYIEEKFGDALEECAEEYYESHRDMLEKKAWKLHVLGEIRVESTRVHRVIPKLRSSNCLEMEIVLYSELTLLDGDHRTGKSQETYGYISGMASGHFDKNLDDLILPSSFENYDPDKKRHGILDESLVPRWNTEDFDGVATAFLRKYYPEVLEKPMAIDTDELVKRMGLKKKICTLTGTGAVFGRIYFRDDMASVYEDGFEDKLIPVKAGTIIVDPDARFLRNVGAENNTVVHECVHWEYHRQAFELERMMNSELSQIACCVAGGIFGRDAWTKSHIVEWQANRLAPCIQMPKAMFERKAKEFLHMYVEECGADNFIDVMEPTIDALADFFDVSRMAAKIRLCQLGYEAARGTFIWLDGHYVPAHAWKRGYLKENQTFSIDEDSLCDLLISSYDLREKREAFRFQYVESHLVLNHPKYIWRDPAGDLSLTDYARSHMDECAIVFTMEVKNDGDGRYNTECFLNRDSDAKVARSFEFHGGLENADPARQDEAVDEMYEAERDLLEHLPRCYPDMMAYLKKRSKMTYKEIGEEVCVDEKTIRRIFDGKAGSIENLSLSLLSMQTPYCVSKEVIEASPWKLNLRNKTHYYLHAVLDAYYQWSMERIRDFLHRRGVTL